MYEWDANYGAAATREDQPVPQFECDLAGGFAGSNLAILVTGTANPSDEYVQVGSLQCGDEFTNISSDHEYYTEACFRSAPGSACLPEFHEQGAMQFGSATTFKISSSFNAGTGHRTWSVWIAGDVVHQYVDGTGHAEEPSNFGFSSMYAEPTTTFDVSNTLNENMKRVVANGGSYSAWDAKQCITDAGGIVFGNLFFGEQDTYLTNVNVGGSQCNGPL